MPEVSKLVQINTATADGSSTTLKVTGIDSDNVYLLTLTGFKVSTDQDIFLRVTKGGTAQSDSEYDRTDKTFREDSSYNTNTHTGQQAITWEYLGDANNEMGNAIIHLFQFNSASEYSWFTLESVATDDGNPHIKGKQGGAVHRVASASDGVQVHVASGNISAGTMTLYKMV